MDGWHATFLGLRHLPRELTAFEVEVFFQYSTEEARKPVYALRLCTARRRHPHTADPHCVWEDQGPLSTLIARMKIIYQGTAESTARLDGAVAERMQRFRKHVRDLRDYLVNNQTSCTNYAYSGDCIKPGVRPL